MAITSHGIAIEGAHKTPRLPQASGTCAHRRQKSSHPRCDEVVAAAKWKPEHVIVAFAPSADPGDIWRFPLLVN